MARQPSRPTLTPPPLWITKISVFYLTIFSLTQETYNMGDNVHLFKQTGFMNTCFMVVWIFRIKCHTALKGNGVVVLISLTGEHDIMFCEEVTVKGVNTEVSWWERTFLHWREQKLRFADGHGVSRACRVFFSLVTWKKQHCGKLLWNKFIKIICLFFYVLIMPRF